MNELSNSEIQETRDILNRFFARAEMNDLFELRDNTIEALQRLRLSILNRMDFSQLRQMGRSISTLMRNFLRQTRSGINEYLRCLACKTILRVLLYGFAAAIGIGISAINTQFDGVADLLAKFFEQSIESISSFLMNYGFQILALNLFDLNDLIEKLCENYGWC